MLPITMGMGCKKRGGCNGIQVSDTDPFNDSSLSLLLSFDTGAVSPLIGTAALTGTATFPTGKFSAAFKKDATSNPNSRIQYTVGSLTTFSYSFWFPTDSSNTGTSSFGNNALVSNYYRGHDILIPTDTNSSLYPITFIGYYPAQDSALTPTTFTLSPEGEYNHCCITYNNTTVLAKIYINGELVATSTTIQSDVTGLTIDTSYIGYRNLLSTYTNSHLDQFMVFNRELVQEEVTALYNMILNCADPTPQDYIAYYPLTGTAEDKTGNYNGTEVAIQYSYNSAYGAFMSGDGTSRYITLAGTTSLTDATFSFWYEHTGVRAIVLGNNDKQSSTDFYGGCDILIAEDGRIILVHNKYDSISYGQQATNIDSITVDGLMHHIVVVKKANAHKIYLDGIEQTYSLQTRYTENQTVLLGSELRIGDDFTGNGNYTFSGKLNRLKIYSRELTQTEITNIYNYETVTHPIAVDNGLIAYYPLANNSLDNYYNQYDGTSIDISYDGTSANFTLSTASMNSNIGATVYGTFSCWFYFSSDITSSGPVEMLGALNQASTISWIGTGNLAGAMTNETLSFYDGTVGFYWYITDTIPLGWRMVTTLWNGSAWDIYIDGVKKTTTMVVGTGSPANVPIDPLLGRRVLNNDIAFTGKAAKLRVYNRVVTDTEVTNIYNTEKGDFGL